MRTILFAALAVIAPSLSLAQGELRILDAEITLEVTSNVEAYKSQTLGLGNIEIDGAFDHSYRLLSGIPQANGIAEAGVLSVMQDGPFDDLHDGYGSLLIQARSELYDFTFGSGEQLTGTFARSSGWYDFELTVPSRVDIISILSESELAGAFTVSGQVPESYFPPFSNRLARRPIYLTAGTHRVQFDTGAEGVEVMRSALLIFNPVPEPSSVVLLSIAGALLATARRWQGRFVS